MGTNVVSLKFEMKKCGLLSASMHVSLGWEKSSTPSQSDYDQGEKNLKLPIDLGLKHVASIRYPITF